MAAGRRAAGKPAAALVPRSACGVRSGAEADAFQLEASEKSTVWRRSRSCRRTETAPVVLHRECGERYTSAAPTVQPRIACGLRPSITGIWISISTTSNGSFPANRLTAFYRFGTVFRDLHRMAGLGKRRVQKQLIDPLSSTTRMESGGNLSASRDRPHRFGFRDAATG